VNYFLDLFNGIMEEADRAQYGVVISSSPQAEGDPKIFEYYQENRIDGIVFVSSAQHEAESREEELIGLLKSRRIPFSVIYGYTDIPDVSYANTDFYRFGQDACRILLERGCRNICYVGAMKKDGSGVFLPGTERLKLNGYRDTMEKSGLTPHTLFLPRDFHLTADPSIAREMAAQGYDGVIACSPMEFQHEYQKRFEAHAMMVRTLALASGCEYRRVSTAVPYLQTLGSFLVSRSG
jgi:DNA-binding LacI/PurR family transcriptional regulator